MAYTGSIPDTAVRRLDWQLDAACSTEDLDTFYEKKYEHLARTVCVVHCPVRAQCLTETLAVERGKSRDHRHGIFAGLDSAERWRLDPTAPGHDEDGSTLLKLDDEPPACGSYEALVQHLARGERVCGTCWSGQVRRVNKNRTRPRTATVEPDPEPLALAPAPAEPAAAPVAAVPAPVRPAPPAAPRKPARRGETPHERRIYTLWSTGADDLDIARRMAVSVPSVKRVRDRLGLLPNLPSRAAS